jgi:hypothetical protein
MNLVRSLVLASTWPKYRAYQRALHDPDAAQARVWNATWSVLSNAPFWRERNTGGAQPPLTAFPLTTYDDYASALDASFQSTTSQLSGEQILFWSVSAGSTGPRKVFPITASYRKQFQTTTPPFQYQLGRAYAGILSAPLLYFAGSTPTERSPAGIEVGFISNFNYRNVSPLVRKNYAFPSDVLRDGATFSEWGPLYALATDLSAMVGITPMIIVRFFEGALARADQYIRVLKGKDRVPDGLPPVKATGARVDLVCDVLGSGAIDTRRLWPSLQMVACWKSSTCGMQLRSLRALLGDSFPIVDATYSATEGWINVPYADGRVGGPVHPGAHVFEFLPLGKSSASDLLRVSQLEVGKSYEIVLTTVMGLVRYRLFDIVRCTGHEGRTPIIEFVQKSSNEISLGPACVSEAELVIALATVAPELADGIVFAPARDGDAIEMLFRSAVAPVDVALVQRELERQNPMYQKYIANGTLRPVVARSLGGAHPVLAAPAHAQSKPKLLLKEPVA